MSEREMAKAIIDRLPEYKMSKILIFLQGVAFDDEMEDDLFCERMVENYLNDPEAQADEGITLEELCRREGISL